MGLYSLGFGVAAGALAQVFPEFADTCQQFRPNGAANPTDPANQIGTVTALFDTAPDFKFRTPSQFGKPQWYGLFDFSATQAGDYLVGAKATWFVAAIEAIHPPLCIRCNRRVLTITRAAGNDAQAQGGPRGYGGRIVAPSLAEAAAGLAETPLMTGWPASVLLGTKGESAPVSGRLPTDTRSPWWKVLLPAVPGVTLSNTDRMTDDLGRAYIISAAELTALGWSITAMEAIV